MKTTCKCIYMMFHNAPTSWALVLFCICGLVIVHQFATTCVTLQNSHRPELLWRYFCARFGLTDAHITDISDIGITDISNDQVGHRGLLIMWSQSLGLSPRTKALLLYFDKWEILRSFLQSLDLELPYPHSESHHWTSWSIGLKWHAVSNYPITLDWKLWFLTQSLPTFPRWKLILSTTSVLPIELFDD